GRFAVTTPGVFLYYPERHQVLPKLRAFIDHIRRAGDAGASPKRSAKRRQI
ncbi:LysR family transcriptional regulator, partial [Mesorhizobium sp. M2D.F.Ca.ET.223.01.1.1]